MELFGMSDFTCLNQEVPYFMASGRTLPILHHVIHDRASASPAPLHRLPWVCLMVRWVPQPPLFRPTLHCCDVAISHLDRTVQPTECTAKMWLLLLLLFTISWSVHVSASLCLHCKSFCFSVEGVRINSTKACRIHGQWFLCLLGAPFEAGLWTVTHLWITRS